jgi:hypothetical protein
MSTEKTIRRYSAGDPGSDNHAFHDQVEICGFGVCRSRDGGKVGIEFFYDGAANVPILMPRHVVGDLLEALTVTIGGTVETVEGACTAEIVS